MGLSFVIKVKRKNLYCHTYGMHYSSEPPMETVIELTGNKQWEALLQCLKSMKWKGKYVDEGVCDGTHWFIKVLSDQLCIYAHGSNQFPPGFDKFMELLNKVTGPHGVMVY
jgi:hypothetical protein